FISKFLPAWLNITMCGSHPPRNSCKGRCGEVFQRGKPCDCDNECSQFGKCCPDYRMSNKCHFQYKVNFAFFPPTVFTTTLSISETPFMLSESILSKEKEGDLEELPISESTSNTYRMAELTTMLMKRQSPELNKSCDGRMDSSTIERLTKLKNSNARSYDIEQPLSSLRTTENCKHTDVQSPETVSTVVPYIESASKITNQAPEEEENQPESSSGNGYLISDVSETTTSINKPQKTNSASEMTKSFTKMMTTEIPGFIEHSATPLTVERKIQASSQTAENSTMGSTKKEESTMPSELLKRTKNTESAMTEETSYTITAKTNLSNPEPTVPVNSASITTQTDPLVPRFTKTHNLENATTTYELQTSKNVFKGVAPGTSLNPKSDQNIKDTIEKLETTFASPITPATIETTKNVSDALVPDDSNLCSGRPANGMTTLRNGTTFVFRGHFFWMLNAHGVEAGYPRKITEEWGIPSPIDTVFTRCNCQGKTFFFKGKNYWRFENGSLDPGYPKLIAKGFNGLSGKITAALSVSAHQRRMESVYFFKQGTVAYLDVKALVIHPCHMKMSSISEVCLNGALGNTHHVQALNLEFLKHFFFAEQTDCIFIPGYATKLVIYPNSRRFD
uniref:SMB domain-containing protein n=1 Tax=Erpetoichthys calabaricus TaxID=27687 RepID=A0A8C4SQE5_ERPCA